MRSEKMAWLFELVGLDTFVLEDGYKAYRSYANQLLSNIEDLLVLQGPTGCGKTSILMALEEAGEQVIDLEGLANHKGSAFGGLGMSDQPTTQQFQNNIFAQLLSFDLNQRIWVESESMSIGKVYLPEALWLSMNDAKRVVINQSKENRLRRIVEEYGHFSPEKLKEKVVNLTQRLGGNNVKIVLEAIDNDNIMLAADALLNYYDKAYSFSAEKYKFSNPVCVDLTSYDPAENAKLLLEKLS